MADRVLLVDDEEAFLLSTSFTLAGDGINNVVQCHDSREVMSLLAKQAGARVVEVNLDETPLSGQLDLSLRGKAAEIVPRLVGG